MSNNSQLSTFNSQLNSNACRLHDMEPPNYDWNMSGPMLTFMANPAHLPARASENEGETTPKTTPTTQETTPKTREKTREKILALILDDPTISTAEMAERIGLTRKGIEWQINQLKQTGQLERIGPARGGHWEILK